MDMKTIFRTTLLHTLAMLPLTAFCLHDQANADASKYEGQSLCKVGDEIEATCTTNTGKTMSICGTMEQKPYIMYAVYGTPENIFVSSPKTGEFPLKYTKIEQGELYYFIENGEQYLAYIFADAGPDDAMDGGGFVTRNISDHKVISHDFCKSEVTFSNDITKISDYIEREEKSPSHISDMNSFVPRDLIIEMYTHQRTIRYDK